MPKLRSHSTTVACTVIACFVLANCGKPPSVEITSLHSGTMVDPLETVQGTASAGTRTVFMVIHPMQTNVCWVQDSSPVTGGAWEVTAHFGEEGPQDSGKPYDVRALTGPSASLHPGDQVPCWPKARAYSQPVHVTRR